MIFRLKNVPFMDMTGLETFKELIEQYRKRGVIIYVCEANARVTQKLVNIGIHNLIAENKIFTKLTDIPFNRL